MELSWSTIEQPVLGTSYRHKNTGRIATAAKTWNNGYYFEMRWRKGGRYRRNRITITRFWDYYERLDDMHEPPSYSGELDWSNVED